MAEMHLFDGRRVRISDLLEANLIQAGEQMVYERPRAGERFTAIVTDRGALQLENGAKHNTPSAAAVAVVGRPVDGWHAWRVERSGRSLDELRQSLLQQVATESRSIGVAELDEVDRYEFLKGARDAAMAGQPVSLTVRELLRHWRAFSRGYNVARRVETDIANYGLLSSPNFRQVRLDSTIRLEAQTSGEEDEDRGDGVPETETPAEEVAAAREMNLDVGLTLGNLESASNGVRSITPNDTIDQAITTMLLYDYSQLLVTSGQYTIRGAVTWESIARSRHRKADAVLADALVRVTEERFDRELTEVLRTIAEENFVIVRGQQNEITGIVTTADVVQEYAQLAGPFFLLGELDQLLRELISTRFDESAALSVCNVSRPTPVKSFDDMTIGDYLVILRSEELWKQLEWPLDRGLFCSTIDELRRLRNDVMHFNPDVDAATWMPRIRYAIRVIREYAGVY